MNNPKIEKIKNIISKKVVWIPSSIVVLVVVLILVFGGNGNAKNVVTDVVKKIDLKQTVLATGQVTSNTDLSLSFNAPGTVSSIRVKVGDKVRSGQVLATLAQGSASASLTSARGAVAAAEARYKKILSGASNEEVAVANTAFENAKKDYENIKLTQETLVKNAYNNLLSSNPEAVPALRYDNYVAPVVTGNYTLGKEGEIRVSAFQAGNGFSFSTSGLVVSSGVLSVNTPQPIGNTGLFISLPPGVNVGAGEWVIELPNKKAANYLINLNAYQNALKTQNQLLSQAQSLVDQRQAELALRSSAARSEDLDLAMADILQAKGQFEQANVAYENTILRAPADGTITAVNVKIGELAQNAREVMVLQDITNMYLEANINEANIVNVKVGSPVSVNFDAFGVDKIFNGSIKFIDPASTLVSGVVNYRIGAVVENVEGLRPGMTANMTININEKAGVLVVPVRAVYDNDSGNKVIRLITDTKKKKFKEVPISTGISGDGGLIEVSSGLVEGDEFVVLIKK